MKKKTFKDYFEIMEDLVSGGLLFLGVTLIFIGVVARYVFNAPLAWVDEISKFIIIWGTLVGAAVALRDNHHIKVDMVFDKLPKGAQKVVTLFANFVGLLYSSFLGYYGWELVAAKLKTGQTTMDLGIPMWIPYLILPLTGLLLGSRYIYKTYCDLKTEPVEEVHQFDHSTF